MKETEAHPLPGPKSLRPVLWPSMFVRVDRMRPLRPVSPSRTRRSNRRWKRSRRSSHNPTAGVSLPRHDHWHMFLDRIRYAASLIATFISRTAPRPLNPSLNRLLMSGIAPMPKGGQAKVDAPHDATNQKPRQRDQPQNSDKPRIHKGGRRNESREVQISKACSYILRHGAAKEGISMRRDGFVRVDDLVSQATQSGYGECLHS